MRLMNEQDSMVDVAGGRTRKLATRRQRMVAGVVAGIGFVGIVGMSVALVDGGLHTRSLLRPVPNGVQATGTVVDVYVHRYKGVVYAPIVMFTDTAGRRHTFRAPTSSEPPTIGGSALVSFDPLNPADAHDLSDNSASWKMPFYTGAILLTFVSLEGLVLGGFVLRRRRSRQTRT